MVITEDNIVEKSKKWANDYNPKEYGVSALKDTTTGKIIDVGTRKELEEQINKAPAIAAIRENYEEIITILREYCDIKEEYYSLTSLWIIGTYLHKQFNAYPYLFVNAMKGSGKTRLLKLISELANNGEITAALSQSVLFRSSNETTMCIDELENIGSRDKSDLREILNACYKKGSKVKRMKKKKTSEGEEYVVEEFELYRPLAMANIWGMEEVLGDRCISFLLEKSSNIAITKLVEDFYDNFAINEVKKRFQCSLCSVVTSRNIYKEWNNYIKNKYITTYIHKHITTLTTQDTTEQLQLEGMFNKIEEAKIEGRNLELFFPLFLIADLIDPKVLEITIKTASEMVKEKKIEEMTESSDVALIDFIATQELSTSFISVRELTNGFKTFMDSDFSEDMKWLNNKWMGRALKRLSLIKEKKRISSGIEIVLDIEKAKKKIKFFKDDDGN